MSIRERIQISVEAKQNGTRRGPYFLHVISDIVDEFLVEGQVSDQDRLRSSEVAASWKEMSKSFAGLWELASGNPIAESDLVNVMWGAFMIGLACDREGLDKSEARKILNSQQMKGARDNIKAYDRRRSDYDAALAFALSEKRKTDPIIPPPQTRKEALNFIDLVQQYFDNHGIKRKEDGDRLTASDYSIVEAAVRMATRKENET